jgi:hypothetical protein
MNRFIIQQLGIEIENNGRRITVLLKTLRCENLQLIGVFKWSTRMIRENFLSLFVQYFGAFKLLKRMTIHRLHSNLDTPKRLLWAIMELDPRSAFFL